MISKLIRNFYNGELAVVRKDCFRNEEFKNEAQECIEMNTCIMDLKFHPSLNSLFVLATEEGNILLLREIPLCQLIL